VIPVKTEHPATSVSIKVYSTQTRKSVLALPDSSWMVALVKTALKIAQSAQMPAHAQSASILLHSIHRENASSHVGLRSSTTAKRKFA